ncbi:MAG: hypothetical protein A2086_00450 [Spirochaetes bacterium GWD1_27_9]|nr:MAG: hypothetical protein A2Z98_13550 [Spirochaetes bacterium GWB1_27_13]OHD43924.1 MAG: hypothetical protein A2086_00450 [Spirochaetes bacterium GWD1_27_9]
MKFFYLLFIIFVLSGCVVIKEMIPQKPTAAISPFDINPVPKEEFLSEDKIGCEYFYVKGFEEEHTPPMTKPTKNLEDFLMETQGVVDLNRSGVVRFFNKEKKAKTILVMATGIYAATGTVANLARGIVRRNRDIEVWVWERRANQLEDRRLLLKAKKEKNTAILVDLLNPKSLKVRKGAFYQPSTQDISFVGFWGVNVQLEDLYNVVKEARKNADEIILSGYSLGVLYATNFLGNDFDPAPDKVLAGYSLVDKVILFDGPPMVEGYIETEALYKNGITIIPNNFIDGKDRLESQKFYPSNGTGDRDMRTFFEMDLKGFLAYIDPKGISPEPYKVGMKTYPITNMARYFTELDENYAFFKLFTATLGISDAKHSGKYSYYDTMTIKGLGEGKDKIDWIYSDKKIEFTNPEEYINASVHDFFNMAEWYQPTRILLDFGSIHHNDTSTGWQSKYFNITQTKNINIPILAIGLSRGLSSRNDIYLNYQKLTSAKDFNIIMINSLTHLDGDTMSDLGGYRQFISDVAVNWISGKNILIEK